jgi:hypothetical protein
MTPGTAATGGVEFRRHVAFSPGSGRDAVARTLAMKAGITWAREAT